MSVTIKEKTSKHVNSIYMPLMITKKVFVPITNVGNNIEKVLKAIIAKEIEGKCITEGYIKPDSINIITYSSGLVKSNLVQFEVVIECAACCPVEGMIISCIAKNITKAGIRAEIPGDYSPLIIFIARDHNYMSDEFNSVKENQSIMVKIVGQRFELNDQYISIIGTLT